MQAPTSMTDVLKKAIADSGLSYKRLEQEIGVTRQSLMGFMKGHRTLRLDIAEKIADYFGLALVKRKGR